MTCRETERYREPGIGNPYNLIPCKVFVNRDQLEYTAPTGFRFLDEPMFCFSTLNANTNPNPNCRPGHRPWPLTPWQSLPGRRPWPLTPWQSLPGHRPWLLTAINRVSGQGRANIFWTRFQLRNLKTIGYYGGCLLHVTFEFPLLY